MDFSQFCILAGVIYLAPHLTPRDGVGFGVFCIVVGFIVKVATA